MVDLQGLGHLLLLAEYRHFGRAAREAGLSQPAFSKSIQRLEQQLGARLFDRNRARVEPTKIGVQVLEKARRVVQEAHDLKRSVDLMRGLQIGSLAVGVGPAMSEGFVAETIAAMAMQHPGIQIRVRVDDWRQLSEWLISDKLDLFVADLAEVSRDNRFECTPLPQQELVWFCRAGHPLADRRELRREDLLKFPLATPRMPVWASDWISEANQHQAAGQRNSTELPNIQCENYSMLKQMVLHSDCISAALYSTIRREAIAGELVVLPVHAQKLETRAGIVQLRDRSQTGLSEKLAQLILEGAAATVRNDC